MEKGFLLSNGRVAAALLLGACGLFSAEGQGAQAISNLAAASNGGHLVFFSSQFDVAEWGAAHLIDGSAQSSWSAKSSGPQSVIIGFAGDGLAELMDVVVNPYSRETTANWIKGIEVWVTTTYPFRDYVLAGSMDLLPEGTQQVFTFPAPTPARYVKLRFTSNHGGVFLQAGEVQVMGRLLPTDATMPGYRELAPSSRIESFTSEYNASDWAVQNLLADDGVPGQFSGSSAGPQEIVIALPEGSDITDVALDNYSRENPRNWAMDVEFQVSTTAAYRDFVSLGSLSVPPIGDLHALRLPEPRAAKYLKVILRSNHGGVFMQASRVRIYRVDAATASLTEQLESSGRAVTQEIHFALDSAEILVDSTPVLREIAAILTQQPDLGLTIEGHTDSSGTAAHNLELSRRRADAVKRWLVEQAGVADARLSTVGYGMDRPMADNASEAGRATNRRVELVRR